MKSRLVLRETEPEENICPEGGKAYYATCLEDDSKYIVQCLDEGDHEALQIIYVIKENAPVDSMVGAIVSVHDVTITREFHGSIELTF